MSTFLYSFLFTYVYMAIFYNIFQLIFLCLLGDITPRFGRIILIAHQYVCVIGVSCAYI